MENTKTRGFELVKGCEKRDIQGDILPCRATKGSAGYDFRCADDIVVPSIWKQLVRNLGFNNKKVKIGGKKRYEGLVILHSETIETDVVPRILEDKKIIDGTVLGAIRQVIEAVGNSIQPTLVHTGIKAYMPEDEVLYLYNRSSNPKKFGLVLANGVGVVDSDYYENESNDGEIMFQFYNFLPFDVELRKGQKIGQGVFQKFFKVDNDLYVNKDRVGGIGSTGE